MFVPLNVFVNNSIEAAQEYASKGRPYLEDLANRNEQGLQEQKRQEELKRKTDAILLKMARRRLGSEARRDMPQVKDITALREASSVPTGHLEFVDPKKLKPIQESHNQELVNDMASDWDAAGKRPVIISKDNWIIDGHHRVLAAKKKNKWVRVIRVLLPGRQALEAVKNFLGE